MELNLKQNKTCVVLLSLLRQQDLLTENPAELRRPNPPTPDQPSRACLQTDGPWTDLLVVMTTTEASLLVVEADVVVADQDDQLRVARVSEHPVETPHVVLPVLHTQTALTGSLRATQGPPCCPPRVPGGTFAAALELTGDILVTDDTSELP